MRRQQLLQIILILGILSEFANCQTTNTKTQEQQQQYHKYLWGTYRPDLLYEYNSIGNEGLAFGIIYHSNKGLDLSNIERCPPPLINQSQTNKNKGNNNNNSNNNNTSNNNNNIPPNKNGYNQKQKQGRIERCKSLPNQYEKQLRYELDQKNINLKAEYKFHDGNTYLQEIIEEQNEILMNIKTIKTHSSTLDDQSWSTFINTQRSIQKNNQKDDLSQNNYNQNHNSQNNNNNEEEQDLELNHSIYFYFVCQKDALQQIPSSKEFKSVRVIDCLETIQLFNDTQNNNNNNNDNNDNNSDNNNKQYTTQKLIIKLANKSGYFTIEDIKNQKDFTFSYKYIQDQNLNFRTNTKSGNMRRILQNDLLSFQEINKSNNNQNNNQNDDDEEIIDQQDNNQRGNILFIKANVKDTMKSIFRISYDSKDREQMTQLELIRLMKSAENTYLQNIQSRILTSYKEVPKSILQIANYALTNILGNIFYIADTSLYTQQQQQQQSSSSSSFFMNQQGNNNNNNNNSQKRFYGQKEILGISQIRIGGNLTPSLYSDGYTLMVLIEWDRQLAEMIINNWMIHRNIDGYSYLDNKNAFSIIQTSFENIHMQMLSQSAPSIILPVNKLFNLYIDDLKKKQNNNFDEQDDLIDQLSYSKAYDLYNYSEDIFFNMLFSSNLSAVENTQQQQQKKNYNTFNSNKQNKQQQQNEKRENQLKYMRWQIDEFSQMYSSSGLDDIIRNKLNEEELITSVDYVSWSIFVSKSIENMANSLSKIQSDLYNDKLQYEETNQTLQQMLINNLLDSNENIFKDKIKKINSKNKKKQDIDFKDEFNCLNSYPYLFNIIYDNDDDEEENNKKQIEINQQKLLTKTLKTPYGISISNSTLTYEQIKQQMSIHENNNNNNNNNNNVNNRLSLKGCYESGDISLIQNYLILRRLYQDSLNDDSIKSLYQLIYNDLLDNIIKNYQDHQEINEMYSKADGKILQKCRQLSAHSVFLLLLNETYN